MHQKGCSSPGQVPQTFPVSCCRLLCPSLRNRFGLPGDGGVACQPAGLVGASGVDPACAFRLTSAAPLRMVRMGTLYHPAAVIGPGGFPTVTW